MEWKLTEGEFVDRAETELKQPRQRQPLMRLRAVQELFAQVDTLFLPPVAVLLQRLSVQQPEDEVVVISSDDDDEGEQPVQRQRLDQPLPQQQHSLTLQQCKATGGCPGGEQCYFCFSYFWCLLLLYFPIFLLVFC